MILFGCAIGALVGFAILYIFGRAIESGKKAGIVQSCTAVDVEREVAR